MTALAREHTQELAAYIGSRQTVEALREAQAWEKGPAVAEKRKVDLDTIFKKLDEDSTPVHITTEQN